MSQPFPSHPVTNRAARRDPTRTATLRAAYVRAMRARFAKLKKLINQTIIENNALMLGEKRGGELPVLLAGNPYPLPLPRSQGQRTGEGGRGVINAKAARQYDWPSDPAGKAEAFMAWLMEAADEEILEVTSRDGRRIVSSSRWQDKYVRGAYGSGIQQATAGLRQAGLEIPQYTLSAVFNAPMHADVLALLFARNFNELKGVTDAMGQQIARTLAEGLASGVGPREIARLISARVDAIGINRATTIARSEVIHAHAEATLNRFDEFGIEGAEGEAEWSTAGDALVCEQCRPLDGKVFRLAEARGMLPLHPNCRCAWKPVVKLT